MCSNKLYKISHSFADIASEVFRSDLWQASGSSFDWEQSGGDDHSSEILPCTFQSTQADFLHIFKVLHLWRSDLFLQDSHAWTESFQLPPQRASLCI